MNTNHYLNNQFLIAMPNLADTNFSQTVSYLCQHNEEGALGIVINRPADMTLGDILKQMSVSACSQQIQDTPVFIGGPVQQERGFIIHSKDSEMETWDSSMSTSDTTSLTSSRDILEAIAEGKGPKQYLIALGYAGWGSGQLEKEMINNAWLNTPCENKILYQTPVEQRWNDAASQIGIDIKQLITPAGHG